MRYCYYIIRIVSGSSSGGGSSSKFQVLNIFVDSYTIF